MRSADQQRSVFRAAWLTSKVRLLLIGLTIACALGCRTSTWLATIHNRSSAGSDAGTRAEIADSSSDTDDESHSVASNNVEEDFASTDDTRLELTNFSALQVPSSDAKDAQSELEAESELFHDTFETDSRHDAGEIHADGTVRVGHSVDLTLNQTVFACLNQHPTIAAAMESIEQTRADFLTSTLLPNPELFTDIQLLPLTRPFTVTQQGGPPQQDVLLTYPIDWFLFGKRAAAMNTANHRVQVSEAEFRDLVRQRTLLASTAFYDALESLAIYKLSREAVKNLQEVERITKRAVEDGGRAAVEQNRVRLDLLASQQLSRTSRADFIGKECRLRAVVGQLRTEIRIRPVGNLAAEIDRPIPALQEAISMAEEERPDLAALRWRFAAEGAETEVQRRAARPTLASSWGYTRQYQEQAIGFPDANSWATGLTMSVPVFDRNQGNISKAASVQRQVQWQLQDARLNIHAEVEQSLAELIAADQNARSIAQEQLVLASSVRDSIVQAYQLGGRPLLDVLDAQRNFRETNRLFITARANYWRALFRFYAAMGRQPDEEVR